MSAKVTEEAFVKVLRTQVRQITDLLLDVDIQLRALEEPPLTAKQAGGRQLRSAPKTGKQRLHQLADQIEKYKSQTQNIFEQLLSRVRTFSTEDSIPLRAGNIATVAAAQDSRGSDTQIENNIIAVNTGDAKIQDKSKSSCKIAATSVASGDVVSTNPQEPLHQHSLPQPTFPHDHLKEQASAPRYRCETSQLFENMVSTIQKAQDELEHIRVAERGYLLLELESPPLEEAFDDFWNGCEMASEDGKVVQGFVLQSHPSGYLEVLVDSSASINLDTIPTLEETLQPSLDPERDFQNWIHQPRQHCTYLICDPLKEHRVNKILDAGSLNLRPRIPGINSAYWYISFEADTPAPMHIEDANTGSANLLLAGADKHWLVIHRSSVSEFEDYVKKEFPLSRANCSQFVRHHDFIPGPLWLKERGITFEIVVQKPGDIMCTLPGRTYHAVRNTGKNFAIAINYEFEDVSAPLDYRWCVKGECGSTAITMEDFQRPLVEDSDISSSSEGSAPMQIRSKNGQIGNVGHDLSTKRVLQEFVKQCSNPEWFGYSSKWELKKDLTQFTPGNQLNDAVLRRLLEVISLPYNYVVVESLGLDITRPFTEHILNDDIKGLIFPFHVNVVDPSSTTGRNHWTIGILDLEKQLFTTYDLPNNLSERYKSSLEVALRGKSSAPSNLNLDVKNLPPNPDGLSCGFCCCLALESYLGITNEEEVCESLRLHYLSKLIQHYQTSARLSEVLPHSQPMKVTAALSLIEPTQIDIEIHTHDHEFSIECLDKVEMDDDFKNTFREALVSTETPVTLERKARIVQMIMQCSASTFPKIEDWESVTIKTTKQTEETSVRTIHTVMEEISRSKEAFSAPTLHQRRLLIELAVMYQTQVRQEVEQMQRARKLRRRAQANGEKLDPLTDSGKTAPNRVLDRIIAQNAPRSKAPQQNHQLNSRERLRFRERIDIGQKLCAMVLQLGPRVLFGLPATTVYLSEIKLPFGDCSHTPLCQAIEPRDYHTMTEADLGFFLHWFDRLNPAFLQESQTFEYQRLLPRYKDLVDNKQLFAENQSRITPMKRRLRPNKRLESDSKTGKRLRQQSTALES